MTLPELRHFSTSSSVGLHEQNVPGNFRLSNPAILSHFRKSKVSAEPEKRGLVCQPDHVVDESPAV